MKTILLFNILLFLAFGVLAQSNYPANTMEHPDRAVTQRSSSYDRNWKNGNDDFRMIKPGETLELDKLTGEGRINHIWFTAFGSERGYPRSMVLRIYWDDSDTPAVEAPLGDFFAVGHGLRADINSSRVANSSHGRSYNSYWSMPFRKSARITVTNDSDKEEVKLYWYIDWEKRHIPDDIAYFHASYRQQYPVKTGEDYLIADIEGKGHYVGTVLSVKFSQPGWFGEGDDRFYIDGDINPTLHGTGTEDYFSDAWGFRLFNRQNYGISVWEGMKTGAKLTAYRWHDSDVVFFDKSLVFAIEHKGNTFSGDKMVDGYTDTRPDMYSSVAFWYQLGKAKPYPKIPPVNERFSKYSLIQAENAVDVNKLSDVEKHESIAYTNGKGVEFKAKKKGDKFTIPFELMEDATNIVYLRVWPDANMGIYEFKLDGKSYYKGEKFFSDYDFAIDVKLGIFHNLKKGKHSIEVIYHGKSETDAKGVLYIDAVVLEGLTTEFSEK